MVTEAAESPRRVVTAATRARQVVGLAGLAAAIVAGLLFLFALWNPWRLVVLEYQFGNPMLGLLVVPAVALGSLWLGFPVRNEARQRVRLAARWAAGALLLAGVCGFGVFGDHFTFTAEEVARSDDGRRALAIVRDRDTPPNSYVRVWTGSGLGAREVGDLGRACGSVSATFVAADRVEVSTTYGTWEFDLDPDTGAPRQVLGPVCSDGPVPAGR